MASQLQLFTRIPLHKTDQVQIVQTTIKVEQLQEKALKAQLTIPIPWFQIRKLKTDLLFQILMASKEELQT
jgi:hypothetical protein